MSSFHETPAHKLNIVFHEPELEYTNVMERLQRFYSLTLDRCECGKPNARILNPEHGGARVHTHDDVWLLLYTQGFRVLVIKHFRSITGPHAARLYYKSHQTNGLLYWIATLQIPDVMFYNEPEIMRVLEETMLKKEFYIAPASRKDIVIK